MKYQQYTRILTNDIKEETWFDWYLNSINNRIYCALFWVAAKSPHFQFVHHVVNFNFEYYVASLWIF